MKKTITLSFLAIAILGTFFQGIEHSNGMVGYTNSPSENNCRSCHGSFSLNSGGGSIASSSADMTSWVYTPGTTYNMTVTVSKAAVTLFGVDVEILDSTGANAGTINVTDAAKTQTSAVTIGGKSRTNLTHKTGGGASSTGAATFNFSWTAPASSVGNVTMYYSGLAADANRGTSGDYVYTGSQICTPAAVVPTAITEMTAFHGLTIYPRPILNTMTISFYSAIAEQTEGFVYDMNGRLVATLGAMTSIVGENNLTIDKPSNVTSGLYLLQLKVGNTVHNSKIVVQ